MNGTRWTISPAGDITREAIELGHDHRAFCLTGKGEGGIQLRPSIKSIGALSGLISVNSWRMIIPSASAKRATAARGPERLGLPG
jgi:hypothetical protein